MRHCTLILILCVLLLGCVSKGDKETINEVTGKKYFEYDNIDYYFNDFDEDKISELFDKQSYSELDSLKMGVILGKIPRDLSDLTFIDKLETIGYTKKKVNKSKFKRIDEVFTEKTVDEIIVTPCIYIYRDILIFKKGDNVVGIAKICFDCWAHEIVGTAASTDNFGQNGDYDRLLKLIRK